jgi:glycosyltransferase involved in cell wall biosynthesis
MLITALLIINLFVICVTLANVAFWPRVRRAAREWPGEVSVLIPARDEESNLPACLDAALGQDATVLEILVYDDHSTDGTADILRAYAGRDSRIRPIEPVPLAPGWLGKNFACARLAAAAKGNWLLFLDADTRLARGAASRMVEEARRRRLTLLSCWPGLVMESFWERALMPMLNFVVFSIFPGPLSLVLNNPSLGLAHGACLMIERASYASIGGHAAVRDQIFEDGRLAQLWRRRGARALCLDGQDLARARMYDSLAEIRDGFRKNFFPAFRREISFWVFLLFHAAAFLFPFLLLIVVPGGRVALCAGSGVLARIMLALRFRHPLWSALLLPMSELVLLSVGLSSWRRIKRGQGVDWRGRRYYQFPEKHVGNE